MVFGWSSNTPPTPRPSYTREQHLQSFLGHPTFSRGTKKIQGPSRHEIYQTTFAPAPQSPPYTLRIDLSPSFPNAPPTITLTSPSPATHPILSGDQCVNLKSLKAWGQGDRGVTLLKVVEEAAGSLVKQAPRKTMDRQPSGGALPPSYDNVVRRGSSSNLAASASASASPSPSTDNTFHMPIPPVPSSFPDLQSMPQSSLQRLLTDDVALNIYVENLPAVKTMQDLYESIRDGNGEAARLNQSQEEELGGLHAEVQVLQAELKDKIREFEEYKSRESKALDGIGSREVMEMLENAKNDAEGASESMSQQFVDGDVKLAEFVKEYMKERTKYHERAAKLERLERQQMF
ncbi:hypothetical protein TrCOL_g9014 [Triparma columacea]|uniref:VPS37 C-terminal domain-containing protein n=1 Tax=Triparma columacea TaxID=722753 RepID=A0A9W7L5M5_9STRA|nr:hypothetical protein TrCOL_g9014 [Triparma columacea]